MCDDISRRLFMQTALTGAATLAASQQLQAQVTTLAQAMPKRQLGKTNLQVSLIGFGAGTQYWENFSNRDQAADLIQTAVQKGINFFDTALHYGKNHESETLLGEALENHRSSIIFATKTRKRDYDGVMQDIEQSLKNLRCSKIELYQFHSIAEDIDIEQLQAEQGGMKAIEKLKSDGVIGHFGITGHSGAKILMKALRLLQPDTVCFPTNAKEVHGYQNYLLRQAQSQGSGIIGMKATGQRKLMENARASDLVHYAVSLSISTLLVGMDSKETLDSCIEIATQRHPMSLKEQEILRDKLALAEMKGPLPYHLPTYQDGYYT